MDLEVGWREMRGQVLKAGEGTVRGIKEIQLLSLWLPAINNAVAQGLDLKQSVWR